MDEIIIINEQPETVAIEMQDEQIQNTTSLKPVSDYHICELCNLKLRNQASLLRHLFQKHLLNHSSERPYVCDVCSKDYKVKEHLQRHTLSHTNFKPYICGLCSKGFARKEYVEKHLLTHSEEKPYVCEICDKCFSQKGYLRNHILTHSNERPFVCDMCDKAYKRKENLQRHILTHERKRLGQMKQVFYPKPSQHTITPLL